LDGWIVPPSLFQSYGEQVDGWMVRIWNFRFNKCQQICITKVANKLLNETFAIVKLRRPFDESFVSKLNKKGLFIYSVLR
jgi:hypothetical protein